MSSRRLNNITYGQSHDRCINKVSYIIILVHHTCACLHITHAHYHCMYVMTLFWAVSNIPCKNSPKDFNKMGIFTKDDIGIITIINNNYWIISIIEHVAWSAPIPGQLFTLQAFCEDLHSWTLCLLCKNVQCGKVRCSLHLFSSGVICIGHTNPFLQKDSHTNHFVVYNGQATLSLDVELANWDAPL